MSKRNYVFISYNHNNLKWAKWLQKKLEWYRLPTEIHNEFSDSRYIRPVFRDRDELTSGVLNDALRRNLEASQHLVVICSPDSAQSEWVSDEVKAFIEMGRVERIVPFIIEGNPQDYSNSDISQPMIGECFPLALRKWNVEHPDKNLLGIAINDDGKTDLQKAFVRLVAHLLGLEFDRLWQRHKRLLHRIIVSLSILAIMLLTLVYWFMIPVKLDVTINGEKHRLPEMEQGVLIIDGREYSFMHPDTSITIGALPGYYRLKHIPISIRADRFYVEISDLSHIGVGLNQKLEFLMHRDSTFAVFAGYVYDGDHDEYGKYPINGAQIRVGEYETTSDINGYFEIEIPLYKQEETKEITINKQGYRSFNRLDENPGIELQYLLHSL